MGPAMPGTFWSGDEVIASFKHLPAEYLIPTPFLALTIRKLSD
jgi:hypothetical protein